jgi:hypothetical protein
LTLIHGTLIGGAKYEDVYKEQEDGHQNKTTDENQTTSTNKIPTLAETARKVARLENTELDEKQYIAYEIIACTFLLGLVRDGNDSNTTLYMGLAQTMGQLNIIDSINDIIRRLEARGAQRQLIMFLTGPAGSGKSTAVTVAQQFCHDFCLAVGVMWGDTTFLFTAYTGAAASLFGGVISTRANCILLLSIVSSFNFNSFIFVWWSLFSQSCTIISPHLFTTKKLLKLHILNTSLSF